MHTYRQTLKYWRPTPIKSKRSGHEKIEPRYRGSHTLQVRLGSAQEKTWIRQHRVRKKLRGCGDVGQWLSHDCALRWNWKKNESKFVIQRRWRKKCFRHCPPRHMPACAKSNRKSWRYLWKECPASRWYMLPSRSFQIPSSCIQPILPCENQIRIFLARPWSASDETSHQVSKVEKHMFW